MATGRIKIEVDTEEADKWLSSVLWHKCEDELPEEFAPVLAYVPDEAPLPTVHEGYVDPAGRWHLTHCFYQTCVEVTHWMKMPESPRT